MHTYIELAGYTENDIEVKQRRFDRATGSAESGRKLDQIEIRVRHSADR